MGLNNHALYQVATKALIFNGDKVLVLHTPDNYIDFPGGRVDESERDIPWSEALKREISEEVGDNFQVDIGQTLFVSKRYFQKAGKDTHIAAIFFECKFVGGDVTLSDEHGNHSWMTMEELLGTDQPFLSEDEKRHLQALYGTS